MIVSQVETWSLAVYSDIYEEKIAYVREHEFYSHSDLDSNCSSAVGMCMERLLNFSEPH